MSASDTVLFLRESGQADRVDMVDLQKPQSLIVEAFLLPGRVAVLDLGLGVDALQDRAGVSR